MVDSLQKETRTGRLELHQQFTHAQSSFDRNLKNTTAKLEGKIEQLKADMPTRFSIMQDVKDGLDKLHVMSNQILFLRFPRLSIQLQHLTNDHFRPAHVIGHHVDPSREN